MTREKMIEALAKAIEAALWENSDEGTFDHGANSQAIVHDMAKASAASVLDLCGPKKLVWQRNGQHWACGRDGLVIRMQSAKRFVLTRRNAFDQNFDTLESAQAAAQSHADAAHWANTVIGASQ